jgi:hypothetical protein
MGITGAKNEVRTCDHRIGVHVEYVKNDGEGAPILYLEGFGHWPSLITLTNQVIRVSCPVCFNQLTRPVPKL